MLDLAHNELGSDACFYIKLVLPTLVSLNLANCKIKEAGAVELAKGLSSAPRLTHLDMS